jgi:hypothetical protein
MTFLLALASDLFALNYAVPAAIYHVPLSWSGQEQDSTNNVSGLKRTMPGSIDVFTSVLVRLEIYISGMRPLLYEFVVQAVRSNQTP